MIDWFVNLVMTIVPLIILILIVYIADTITGVMKAKSKNTFCSSKLKDGFRKLGAYFCVIIGAISVDFILNFYIAASGIDFDNTVLSKIIKFMFTSFIITKGFSIFVVIIEIISIVENAKELGVDIPMWFIKLLGVLKKFFESGNYEEITDEDLKEETKGDILTVEELQKLLDEGVDTVE